MRCAKWVFGVILGLASALGVVSAQAGWCPMCGGYGGWYGMGALGWVIMILVTIAIILFIIWLLKQIQKK